MFFDLVAKPLMRFLEIGRDWIIELLNTVSYAHIIPHSILQSMISSRDACTLKHLQMGGCNLDRESFNFITDL